MNFVKECVLLRKISIVLVVPILVLFFNGCKSNNLSTLDQLAEFQLAGPIQPEIDLDKLNTPIITGTYRTVIGDVLELRMASALNVVTAELPDAREVSIPTLCRVYNDGAIIVPVIGQVPAAGRTLAEIETSIANAYYPEYSSQKPAVIVRVSEYKTIKISISGAVEEPGVYKLRSDEKSLVSLLMKAGGIIEDGAALIHIKQHQNLPSPEKTIDSSGNKSSTQAPDANGASLSLGRDPVTNKNILRVRKNGLLVFSGILDSTSESVRQALVGRISTQHPDIPTDYIAFRLRKLFEVTNPDSGGSEPGASGNVTLTLPIKGLNIPFADVALQDGFSVVVEPLNPQVFTVVGLVKLSGVFPYAPNVRYNLMQALAFAGGVDEIADPRFVKVYRQKANGDLIAATFKLNGTSPVGAPAVMIKPGDVVAVEQTDRTHWNLLLAEIVGARATVSYQVFDGRDFRRTD